MRAAHYPNTEDEARAEARRRLGPSADVHSNTIDRRAPCRISVVRYAGHGTRRVIVARGFTWERAFFSLDKRETRTRVRRRAPRPRKSKSTPLPQTRLDL